MDILNKIYDYALEEIMGERFANYSKAIIQDRALPDIRDGLKPVQRRILYAMYRDKNTYDKAYKKSAKAVGNIMGNYHPHGDSSIYEALVRMSQWWKQNTPYIDMHGNNGSIDGDGAAAMRYTEARLDKISIELLKDIDKDTVDMIWNFDDTLKEPIVLPAKFPNLLVNGSTGISAGYATNIPPHNLSEIIDATIKRIESPNCRLETILELVKGPDFPTGGIVEGKNGIIDAFKTGRGKVILKSKITINKEKGKEQIIVEEIPFDINRPNLIRKIDEIRIEKKIEGIQEVRDEGDINEPARIAIDLKKDANKDLIINYLLKNTDLQISYNYNMVSIVNGRPMTVGIMEIIDAYIAHQKEVITRRSKFDLEVYKKRMHIIEGLIKALSILDEVIKTIRKSKNKMDAKNNLVKEYAFTEEQAEAIVVLQLYKLTNTDVTELNEEYNNLKELIKTLEMILNDEEKMKSLMKHELKKVREQYATPRKTEIKDEITEIKIDTISMIPKEDVIVVVTHDGYLKKVSLRSYAKEEPTLLKEGDYIIGLYKINTIDTLLLFTDMGNYLYIPVHQIPDLKWKELGKHVSNIIKINPEENIIYSMPVYDFDSNVDITMISKNGMIKRTQLNEFKALRYNKPITAMKLKDNDKVVSIISINKPEIFIVTNKGFGLRYNIEEVAKTRLKSAGVKAIQLKDDYVVSANLFDEKDEYISVITNKNTGKRIRLNEFDASTRARKGIQVIRDVKTNPYYILNAFIENNKANVGLKIGTDITYIKNIELPIFDRYSTGSTISKHNITTVFIEKQLEEKNIKKEEKIVNNAEDIEVIDVLDVELDNIDEKMMTIDDFLDDFKV